MKKRNLILSAAITAALLSAAGAQANGTVSPTALAAGGETVYAMEGINAAALTLPSIVYTMGVGRAVAGQDMVIVYTLPTGVTFNATPAAPVFAGISSSAAPAITFKRGGVGTNEAVYSVSIGASAMLPTDTITLTTPVITSGAHGMTANGSSLSVQVKLLDQVETACVDNAGSPASCFLTSRVASLAKAAEFWNSDTNVFGVISDMGTVTDVRATVPLAGFVVANNDTATVAAASVQIVNAVATVMQVGGSIAFSLGATDIVTMTITDPTSFLGKAAGNSGLYFAAAPTTAASADNTFTIAGTTATRALAGDNIDFNSDEFVMFTSDATNALGVSRVLSIAGAVAPIAGIAHAFTGNNAWWTWTSNGTVLETSMFSNATGYNNRFVFMNYGTIPVTYSSTCLVEAGKTAVAGSKATGTLVVGQNVILSADVCTITGAATVGGNTAARGGARFTINAPISAVKGTYNSVAPNGSFDAIEMLPPRT
jgi:hypothetical protein